MGSKLLAPHNSPVASTAGSYALPHPSSLVQSAVERHSAFSAAANVVADLPGCGQLSAGLAWLLQLLCSEAATPLLLRLQVLRTGRATTTTTAMPSCSGWARCRLRLRCSACRPCSGSIVQLLCCPSSRCRTSQLHGLCRRREFLSFVASFTSAPAPLAALVLFGMTREAGDDERDDATAAEDAEAVRTAARLLLSRFPSLRRLHCSADVVGGALGLPDSRPGGAASGCSASLYIASCRALRRPVFGTHVSFLLLTELVVIVPLTDQELEPLLSGCPQMLKLAVPIASGWHPLAIAARCCPRLLALTAVSASQRSRHLAAALPAAVASSSFLPELLSLTLTADKRVQNAVCDFSVLRHFTTPPHAQLRRLNMAGSELTAEHVLALACLPQLCHVQVNGTGEMAGREIAEMEEARNRAQQRLLSTAAADGREGDMFRPTALRHECEGEAEPQPLGPHKQQEMRQRVLEEASQPSLQDLLRAVAGAGADTVRTVFFAELGAG